MVPRSILSDFGPLFGSRFGTKNIENPALEQQLEVFFQPCVSLAAMRSARAPSDAKKREKQWRVVQKQCVPQIRIGEQIRQFDDSFRKAFGYLGRHFGGLEGSQEHCKIYRISGQNTNPESVKTARYLSGFWALLTAIEDRRSEI